MSTTRRRSIWRKSLTPSSDVAPDDEYTYRSIFRSSQSDGNIPTKKRNPFLTSFLSLRKSAKHLFRNKGRKGHSVTNEPRKATEISRIPPGDFAAIVYEDAAIHLSRTFPFDPDTLQPNLAAEEFPLTRSPSLGPTEPTEPTTGHTLIELSDPNLPLTESICELPLHDVFTAQTPEQIAPIHPIFLHNTEFTSFDFETAIKDMASRAFSFPTPDKHRSAYLDGAIVYLKCVVFVLASFWMCVIALPWACFAYLGPSQHLLREGKTNEPEEHKQYAITSQRLEEYCV